MTKFSPEEIVDKFIHSGLNSHPVWILVTSIDRGLEVGRQILAKLGLHPNDTNILNISRETLREFSAFLELYPDSFKVAVCTLRSDDPYLIAALLKKFEDLPKFTSIILITKVLPSVLQNRGAVFHLEEAGYFDQKAFQLLDYLPNKDITEEMQNFEDNIYLIKAWFEQKLLKYMVQNNAKLVDIAYKTWNKLIEIIKWCEIGQINRLTASQMMISILMVARMPRQ